MKRILIDGMTQNTGGVEKFIYTLYTMIKDSYEIDFMTVDKKISYEEEFLKDGCNIYRITPRYVSLRAFQNDIKKVYEQGNYDILWLNKTTLSSIDSLKMAKRNHVGKIICHSHASENLGSLFTLMMHKHNRRSIDKYVDYKVACSENAANWFFGKNIEDVKIFQNAVDIAKYEPKEEIRNQKRKELHVENKFVLGHIGRFSEEKNHKFILDVFAEIAKQTDAQLLLCGDGELKGEIQEYAKNKGIEEKVSFLGIRKDIPELLQAVDVVIFPSLFEGLPFALVEAQAGGVPCVVSDTVSREAKLTDLMHFLSLQDDVKIWAEKILEYREYQKVSKADQLIEKGYSLQTMEKNIREILES